MGCLGERVSDGGMIAMICHGDMGVMFFLSCVYWYSGKLRHGPPMIQ